jgi:glycosyltransferase involved in cell wall biosynthesis
MFVSVILSTYDSPEWLTKVVWGYAAQTHMNFEVVIADDGSDERTARCIGDLRNSTKLSLQHVWQAKRGFSKCRILNRAIQAATSNYLIFSDGDCIPRADFVVQHVRLAASNRFLSGGVVRLPLEVSQKIGFEDIVTGRVAKASWLAAAGCFPNRKFLRLTTRNRISALLDRLTPTQATFNGHNSSAWKADILRVNGFDERLG